ncbi:MULTISPECIES: lysozyme inhibitor LprI family protein [unclassified Flavobacterium]|uniref:lysozyme inhibitor LprI family protein n=1 Tax=unclassified Flavobacterium TaxID=196869 RepID=UPI003F8FF573
MKNRLLLLLLLSGTLANAQSEITKAKLAEIKAQVEKETIKLKDSLIKANKGADIPLDIAFKTDLYRAEKLADKKVSIDYSTSGMTTAIVELNNDYDKLLNKYYTILLKKLNPKDQDKLKIAQRNWIKFRDSEIQLIGTVSKSEYSGGGTIQSNIMAGRISDLTKNRLYVIKEHLNQFID